MASRVKATVRGDREIIANMRRAYNSVGGAALDRMINTSLEPMRERTEQNARNLRQVGYTPKGGHLDEGVVIAKRAAPGSLQREYWISFRKRARKIAHLVEFGTAPHFQPRRNIMHPGARPHPFFRPAFEAEKVRTVSILSRAVWDQIRASLVSTMTK